MPIYFYKKLKEYVSCEFNRSADRSYVRYVSAQQVKEDVAWLLEDASDGGWKPVRDDGRVKVTMQLATTTPTLKRVYLLIACSYLRRVRSPHVPKKLVDRSTLLAAHGIPLQRDMRRAQSGWLLVFLTRSRYQGMYEHRTQQLQHVYPSMLFLDPSII